MLLPDLAAMLVAATLAYCLFVRGGAELFRDSDSGWHIRNGESVLASGTLPRTDPYSFSKAGEPWIAWEWGSDVLMGIAHRAWGLRGVAVLTSLAIAGSVWMWCRLGFAVGGDFFLTAALAPLMVTASSVHWFARPHVFGWLFVLGGLLYLETVQRAGAFSLAAVAAIGAIWANLHASFFLGPALALAYAIGTRAKKFVWIAAAAFAGSFVNPYGWRLHAHVFSYLFNDELTSRIAEFQSFNFHDRNATQIALVMAVAAAGAVLALAQRKYAHFLIVAALWFGALRSARLIPLVALAALPFANAAITRAFPKTALLKYSQGLRAIDAQVSGAIFTPVAVLLMLLVLRSPVFAQQITFSVDEYPVEAAGAIERFPVDARIASTDHFGGYLIYRFEGKRKVFFDGRSDFYGADFMKEYAILNTARPGWRDILHRFGFKGALLPNDSALLDALEHDGWKTVARDRVATLVEAP